VTDSIIVLSKPTNNCEARSVADGRVDFVDHFWGGALSEGPFIRHLFTESGLFCQCKENHITIFHNRDCRVAGCIMVHDVSIIEYLKVWHRVMTRRENAPHFPFTSPNFLFKLSIAVTVSLVQLFHVR
jgi:hypothetical protein